MDISHEQMRKKVREAIVLDNQVLIKDSIEALTINTTLFHGRRVEIKGMVQNKCVISLLELHEGAVVAILDHWVEELSCEGL